AELRTRLEAGRQRAAVDDSTRAARQRQPLAHPLASFTGTFGEPSFGDVTIAMRDGRLTYRWGAQYGPVEIMDASRHQLRVEVAGSGHVVTFAFDPAGVARSIQLQGVTFTRRP
ncbi:MAG: hypothetical protein H7066_04745, partial [Cytophagaceae bacterium]|nr:hypothetical protein [Gemmatimonadaceae bacterium]